MYQDCINFFLTYVKEQIKGDKDPVQVEYYITGLQTFLEEIKREKLKELENGE